jgi:hypothetical protein
VPLVVFMQAEMVWAMAGETGKRASANNNPDITGSFIAAPLLAGGMGGIDFHMDGEGLSNGRRENLGLAIRWRHSKCSLCGDLLVTPTKKGLRRISLNPFKTKWS